MENGGVLEAIAALKTELLARLDQQKIDLLGRMEEQNIELLGRIDKQKSDLIDHMHGIGAGLHTQIEDLDRRVGERFDHIEKRLDLQGGLVQSGARALARFTEWSESTDLDLSRYDRRISDIERRLSKLENPG